MARIRLPSSLVGGALAVVAVATTLVYAGVAHGVSTAASPSLTSAARDAAVYALGLIGVAYRDGGDSPERGFDCSGLTRHVLARTRVADLPRTARQQGETGAPVQREALQSGDLVFFDTQGGINSHVGIYVGDGRFVHAPGRGKEVTLADLGSPYWQRHYNGARRHSAHGAPSGDAPDPSAATPGRSWWMPVAGSRGGAGVGNLPIDPDDVR